MICANPKCGKEFEPPKGSKRTTCSDSCRGMIGWIASPVRATRPINPVPRVACAICGRIFKPKARRLKCCSRKCGITFKQTPAYRARLRDIQLKSWRDDPTGSHAHGIARMTATKRTQRSRDAQSAENRRRWSQPDYRERVGRSITAALLKPSTRQQLSENLAARWADPKARNKMLRALRIAQALPSTIQKKSISRKRWLQTATEEERTCGLRAAWARMEEIWADPVQHAAMLERIIRGRRQTKARNALGIISADQMIDATVALIINEHGTVRTV